MAKSRCAWRTIGAEERTSLRFEVRDTGSGITESVRNRLFQPFSMFQPINSTGVPITGGNQGNGLSLAISKQLVELMGGKIDVAPSQAAAALFLSPLYLKTFAPVPNLRLNPTRPVRPPLPERPELGTRPPISSKLHAEGKNRRERRAELQHGVNYPTLLRAEAAGMAVLRVLDVSASGLRVLVPFCLIPRTEVEIRIEGTSVVGVVRNCTCIAANEFYVGIQIPREASADEQERLNHLRLLRIVRAVDSDTELDEEGPANPEALD